MLNFSCVVFMALKYETAHVVRSLSGKNWQDLYKADKGSISFPATPKSN